MASEGKLNLYSIAPCTIQDPTPNVNFDVVADKRRGMQRAEEGRQEQRTTDEGASRRYSVVKASNS